MPNLEETQSTVADESQLDLQAGWTVPQDIVPHPTYWPVVMALGITFVAFGIVTTPIISVVGVILFIISLAGWIGDIRNEQKEHEHEHN